MSPIDLTQVFESLPTSSSLWIIAGGMSGQKVTETPEDWFLSVRDQCVQSGVPFHFKQWGVRYVNEKRISKAKAGRSLDGREWNGFPHDKNIDQRK